MARDTVGNSLTAAKTLKLGAIVRGQVGKLDKDDFYRVSLATVGSLKINFRSSGAKPGMAIIQDRNSNGLVDAGEVLTASRSRRSISSPIAVDNLSAGTYFLRVYQGAGETNYQLVVSTQPSSTGSGASQVSSASNSNSSTSPSTTSSSPSSPLQTVVSSFIDQVVQLTNAFRQQNGLPALTDNSNLNQAAQTQSQNMALQDFFDHTGLDGSHPWDRMTAAGYHWSRAAENIAAGQRTPEEVVTAWINSPGHRANMLDPNVKDIGVGYYELVNDTGNVNYNRYWTQVFGAP